jgi:hypothetical protein
MKASTSFLLSTFCLATLPVFSAFATSEPAPFGDCQSDADCAPDQYCALVMPMICEMDGEDCLPPDDSELAGLCTDFEETESCNTDDDCADGYYCEVPGATCGVVCDEEMDCETFCDEMQESLTGHCIAEFVDETTECFEDSDCGPGELCHHVMIMFEDEPGQPAPPAPGICGPAWEEEGCVTDADCGEDAYCERWYVAECDEPAEDDAGERRMADGCDDVVVEGVCVDYGIPPNSGHCESNADCGPDAYCNTDYGWCEEYTDIIVEPPVSEACVTDEECGPGGFCILDDYACPPGVMCMMPAQPLGYCEYHDGPSEEPECIVAVYDECVVYAGGDEELSCDASSGAPTWLAFLAILGMVRRRKAQR